MRHIGLRRLSAAKAVAILALVALAGPAAAATSEVSASGFLVTLRQEVKASPHSVYDAIGKVDKWWNPAHTWSGNAANLSLSTQASGCFCERWDGNSVEHGHVVVASKDRMLRLQSSLGPLQAMAVDGVLTFAVSEKDGKTTLQLTYRVSGNEAARLQDVAGPVDGVLADQLQRLVSFTESGKPQ
jgi:hypothetical protein